MTDQGTPEWRQISDGGFNSHIGPISFARTGEAAWQGRLELAQKHMNLGGVCHGGVYMALADVAMGIAAHEVLEGRGATIDLDAHFLAAAKLGQILVADVQLGRAVSGIVFLRATLSAGGREVMTASGIWKRLNLPG